MGYAFLIGFFISHTLGYSALSSGTSYLGSYAADRTENLVHQASQPSLSDSRRILKRWRTATLLCSSLFVGLTPRSPRAFEVEERGGERDL